MMKNYFDFHDEDYDFDLGSYFSDDEESATDQDHTQETAATADDETVTKRPVRRRKGSLLENVKGVKISVASAKQGLCSDTYVEITLHAAKGCRLNANSFKCMIFTDDLYPMVVSSYLADVTPNRGAKLCYGLGTSAVWLPGRYFLLLRDVTGRVQRRNFTLDDKIRTKMSAPRDCKPYSEEDILANHIEEQFPDWENFAIIPGAASLRKWVVKRTQMKVLNGHRFEPMYYGSSMLIYRQTQDFDENNIKRLSELLIEKGDYLQYMDCTRLYDASRPNPYEVMNDELCPTKYTNLCLDNLSALVSPSGKLIMKRVLELTRGMEKCKALWLCGTRQEIDALLKMYPSLEELFTRNNIIRQEPYSAFDLVQVLHDHISQMFRKTTIPLEVTDAMARAILKSYLRQPNRQWTIEKVQRYVVEVVRSRYLERTLKSAPTDPESPLAVQDLDLDRFLTGSQSFDACMSELNEMIGLDSVKQGIRSMANMARLYKERQRRGLHTSDDMIFHSVFTGNPGTGKTTVARMLGRIYHSLGLLSRGDVVEVDRSRLVGQYIGQTEDNMKVVLEEARGNVLFIDEAYTLFTGGEDRKDFGLRVIDTLMTVLTQPNPDMLIVFAGYPREMERLLATNPGLAGRFPYRYLFPDYSAEQLMLIARKLFERDDYILTSDAEAALHDIIARTLRQPPANFHNARWIVQMVRNGIIPAMADRVFAASANDFQHILVSDIRLGYERLTPPTVEPQPQPQRKQVIGFCA